VHAGRLLRRAAAVLTGSQFSKESICTAFGVPAERVRVAAYGVDHERFRPDGSQRPASAPYLLYAGGHTPRKNVPRMIAAFARVRSRPEHRDLRFVLAGPVKAAERDLRAGAPSSMPPDALSFPGHLPDDDVVSLYQRASALLYASLCEGFGLPALEAMACGVPVIGGAGSSLDEVVGTAGELPDPTDVTAIEEAILGVLQEDEGQRADRRARGIEHAARFTWERCARSVLSVYDNLAPG
jgi:glycosyltransferase involved in cell wall biosynthesis